MARIKPSVVVADIRGKIQGSIFQASNAGLVLKSNRKRVNKNSLSQSLVKSITAALQSQWQQLSTANRDTWNAFATFAKIQHRNNAAFFINAQQAFIKINAIRIRYGLAILNPPDFSKCVTLSVSFTVALNGAALELTASRLIDSSVEFVVCFITVPVSAAINNPGSRFKILVFTTTTDTTFDITASYIAVFGRAPVPGETIFTRAYVANKLTGLFTAPSVTRTTL